MWKVNLAPEIQAGGDFKTPPQIYPLLKTLWIQISLLLTKPSDQDPHCCPLNIHGYIWNTAGKQDENWRGMPCIKNTCVAKVNDTLNFVQF